MKAVDILLRLDRLDDASFVNVFGKRQLNQYSVDGVIIVEVFDERNESVLTGIGRKGMLD